MKQIIIINAMAFISLNAIELILRGEIESDSEEFLSNTKEEGFLEELNFLAESKDEGKDGKKSEKEPDMVGEFEIVHSEAPAPKETKKDKEQKQEVKKGYIEKKMDREPTKFTDGSPYYAH